MEDPLKPIQVAADKLASETDTDVFLYNSGIARPFDDEVISACCGRKRRKNVTLILVTEGGEPDAAFRIARAFQDHYTKFTCIVSGYCKSAGTLILTGANELVMTDWGELGPLDVQMAKKDELGERESGLLVTSALEALRRSAFLSFEHFFLTMQRKSRWIITFKTAAEYASKLTTGLFAPIYGQIDPRLVAESSRAQAIGLQYGSRLGMTGQNIDPDCLNRLIGSYPTHGFVIDRAEAEGLFKSVRKPTADEMRLIGLLDRLAVDPQPETDGFRYFLSGEGDEQSDNEDANPHPNSGSGDAENHGIARQGIEQPGATDGADPAVA
jgi:serine dehydrogenase proteinase